jgi:hypothetical protein
VDCWDVPDQRPPRDDSLPVERDVESLGSATIQPKGLPAAGGALAKQLGEGPRGSPLSVIAHRAAVLEASRARRRKRCPRGVSSRDAQFDTMERSVPELGRLVWPRVVDAIWMNTDLDRDSSKRTVRATTMRRSDLKIEGRTAA